MRKAMPESRTLFPEYIDASTITALVNPLTVKQDTLEYNAAAFRIGANDMLEDLLKKMPGMSIIHRNLKAGTSLSVKDS